MVGPMQELFQYADKVVRVAYGGANGVLLVAGVDQRY